MADADTPSVRFTRSFCTVEDADRERMGYVRLFQGVRKTLIRAQFTRPLGPEKRDRS